LVKISRFGSKIKPNWRLSKVRTKV